MAEVPLLSVRFEEDRPKMNVFIITSAITYAIICSYALELAFLVQRRSCL